jgi:hypothetical protein
MQIAKLRVKPLTDDGIITDDHRANQRVWTYFSAPVLSQLQSSHQVRPVRACELGIHTTD